MAIKCETCKLHGGCETYALFCSPARANEVVDTIISCEHYSCSLENKVCSAREEVLKKAIKCVCTDRNEKYGEPEDSFGCIAELWSLWRGVTFTPHDVAVMMALLKLARIKDGRFTSDSYVDAAGYLACAAEAAERETEGRQ